MANTTCQAESDSPSTSRLLRVEDVADRLAVSLKTIRRLVASGRLEAVHIGAAVRFTAAELERFITAASRRRSKPVNSNSSKA